MDALSYIDQLISEIDQISADQNEAQYIVGILNDIRSLAESWSNHNDCFVMYDNYIGEFTLEAMNERGDRVTLMTHLVKGLADYEFVRTFDRVMLKFKVIARNAIQNLHDAFRMTDEYFADRVQKILQFPPPIKLENTAPQTYKRRDDGVKILYAPAAGLINASRGGDKVIIHNCTFSPESQKAIVDLIKSMEQFRKQYLSAK